MEDSTRIKHRQTWMTLAAVTGVVGLVILGLFLSDPARRADRASGAHDVTKRYRTPAQSLDPSEVWISRSETELNSLKQANDDLRRELTDIRDKIERLRRTQDETSAPPGKTLPPLPAPTRSSLDPRPTDRIAVDSLDRPAGKSTAPALTNTLPPPPLPAAPRFPKSATASNPAVRALAASSILSVDLDEPSGGDNRVTADGGRKSATGHPRDINSYLPAGAFAKAVLLSGLDAPTGGLAKTNPQPVLLRLLDPGTLPNRYRSHIRECFVTAAGYGDLASERAYLRLEKLSCVLNEGRVLEVSLKGFITGEDGKAGLRGRLVSKQGQLIARALISGIAGGIGSGVAQSYTSLSTNALGNVQSVDPAKIAQYGFANGFASALDRISKWYLDRANEVYPVLEVDAGRTVDVVLNEGLDLDADKPDRTAHNGG